MPQVGRSRVRLPMSLEFFFEIILPPALLPQPLTEMCTRSISWGVKADGLTTLPPSFADCLEIWEPQPSSGPLMALLAYKEPYTLITHSSVCAVFYRSATEIAGSNCSPDINVFPRFYCLCIVPFTQTAWNGLIPPDICEQILS